MKTEDKQCTVLLDYIEHLLEDHNRDKDRIVRQFSSPHNVNTLQVLNPSLKLVKTKRLVVNTYSPVFAEGWYYLTYRQYEECNIGVRFIVADYSKLNFQKTSSTLDLRIVEYISPFVESKGREYDGKKLKDVGDGTNEYTLDFHELYQIDTIQWINQYRTKEVVYFSDIKWCERSHFYMRDLPAFNLLEYPIEAVTFPFLPSRWSSGLDLRDLKRLGIDSDVRFRNKDFKECAGLFDNPIFNEQLRAHCSLAIVDQLKEVEFPLLRSIIRAYRTSGKILDGEMRFINNVREILERICELNAVANLAYRVFFDFCEFLEREGTLKRCNHCGYFFRLTNPRRQYCKPKTEGRDCQRVAASKRDYKRHQPKRQEAARKRMPEYRDYYLKMLGEKRPKFLSE